MHISRLHLATSWIWALTTLACGGSDSHNQATAGATSLPEATGGQLGATGGTTNASIAATSNAGAMSDIGGSGNLSAGSGTIPSSSGGTIASAGGAANTTVGGGISQGGTRATASSVAPVGGQGNGGSQSTGGVDGSGGNTQIGGTRSTGRTRQTGGAATSTGGANTLIPTGGAGTSVPTGGAVATGGTTSSGNGKASALASKLGVPNQFLVGYGEGSTGLDPFSGEWALGTPIYILENYLYGLDGYSGSWTTWNTDSDGDGAFVNVFFDTAQAGGAVPMFTLYQMIASGMSDGGLGCLDNKTCVTNYFKDYKILLTRVASYGLPALIHIEPDMIGYAQLAAENNDPTTIAMQTSSISDCSDMPANLVGYVSCLVHMRDLYAPKAYIGFAPAAWLGVQPAVEFMSAMGIAQGDYVSMQTLDRDVGCYESNGDGCSGQSPTYWKDADFTEHLAETKLYHDTYNLPIIWWQTPLGVPSTTAGRNPYADYGYRDNRVQYFLTNTQKLVDAGGLGAVFGQGQGDQTDISTDIMSDGSHQLKKLLTAYNASPVALP